MMNHNTATGPNAAFYNNWHVVSVGHVPYDLSYNTTCLNAGAATALSSGQLFRWFSDIGGGTSPTPLPIEMLPLQAEGAGDHIRVHWTTTTEQNSSHFVLERSTDNQNFEVLNPFIQAANNSSDPLNYEHLDFAAEYNQPYFYRLRMVDLDGQTAMSNIAEAMITEGASSAFFYPNPASNSLNLHVFATAAQDVTMKIYDATGRIVYNNVFGVEAGTQDIDLAAMLNRLAMGTYNAVVTLDGDVHTTKLVVNN
jgi:hypothetical protein